MFTSQKFIDTRTGEIGTQVPLSQIAHFEEYDGPLQAGDFDTRLANHMAKPDFLDSHLEIVGLSSEAAEQIKDRLRREF